MIILKYNKYCHDPIHNVWTVCAQYKNQKEIIEKYYSYTTVIDIKNVSCIA